MNYLEWFFVVLVMLGFVCLVLPIPILRLTLDRRVRKQLPVNKVYDNYPDWYFGFGRAIIFAYAAIWNRANNSWQMKVFYDDFNVRTFANAFERLTAYCFCFGLLVMVVGGGIYTLLELFGIVNME